MLRQGELIDCFARGLEIVTHHDMWQTSCLGSVRPTGWIIVRGLSQPELVSRSTVECGS